jgi:DNA-binding XRE family transcriptional regulator
MDMTKNNENEDRKVKRKEAAKIIGVSPQTLDRLCKSKKIPCYKSSARIVNYSVKDLQAYNESVRVD